MSTTTAPAPATFPERSAEHHTAVGPIGRLGRYTATHFRTVLIGWAVVAVVLGFFAPKVETALSGASWKSDVGGGIEPKRRRRRSSCPI
jgi:hypothetical protein